MWLRTNCKVEKKTIWGDLSELIDFWEGENKIDMYVPQDVIEERLGQLKRIVESEESDQVNLDYIAGGEVGLYKDTGIGDCT